MKRTCGAGLAKEPSLIAPGGILNHCHVLLQDLTLLKPDPLAIAYDLLGKHLDAEALFLRALDINEKALGSSHPAAALSLSRLVLHYQQMQHNYIKAESFYKRALIVMEVALGPDRLVWPISWNPTESYYKKCNEMTKRTK